MRITYHVDQEGFARSVQVHVRDHQEMFLHDLDRPFREAARRVIYGNFMGSGSYSPRPIGKFSNTRAQYLRGWVQSEHQSQRQYLAQLGGRQGKQDGFDSVRLGFVNEKLRETGKQPVAARVTGQVLNQLPGRGFVNLRKDLAKSTPALTRQVPRAGKMRYGVQTGKLAKAWYDLGVGVTLSGKGLSIALHPKSVPEKGTPDAARLTQYLSHNAGWRGLMDDPQLKAALRDQGVHVK